MNTVSVRIPAPILSRLALALGLGLSGWASAATYHVSPSGNDGSCDGSAGCAFKTIQKGIDTAQPGDTVTVHAGSYPGFKTVRAGSPDRYIAVTRNGSDAVTVTGQISVDHNWIALDGLKTTYSSSYEGGAAIRVGQSSRVNHIRIANCHIVGNGNTTYLVKLNADDVEYHKNLMEGPRFYIGIVQIGARQKITDSVFRNVVDVERIFNVAASDSLWRGNEIYGLSWTGDQRVHPDIWQTVNDGSVARNNVIEGNYIHDTGGAQVGNIATNAEGTSVSDWTFRNNVFANSGTLYLLARSFRFYNNTYYRTGAADQATVLLYTGTGNGNASGAEFKNNLYVQETNQAPFAVSQGSPSWSHDHNFVTNTDYSPRGGFSEPNGINGGNPKLAKIARDCTATACDFRIAGDSPARDKGATLSGFSTDKDGNPRSGAWDIGSYEISAGSVALKAPENLRIVE